MLAYAWASGLIGFGDELPEGALIIRSAVTEADKALIEVRARRGYKEELLVPGVPEAKTEDDAVDALIAWCDWVFPYSCEKKVA